MTKLGKGKEKGEKKVRRGQREKEREGMKEKRREQMERRGEERKGEKRQPTIIIVENFHSALSNRQDLQKKKHYGLICISSRVHINVK